MCLPHSVLNVHVAIVAAAAAVDVGACVHCRYAFFDTDNVIELAHPGESVADIFRKYGEEYFRNCESQVGKHAPQQA